MSHTFPSADEFAKVAEYLAFQEYDWNDAAEHTSDIFECGKYAGMSEAYSDALAMLEKVFVGKRGEQAIRTALERGYEAARQSAAEAAKLDQ